mgnify:CR=1 FL=1
MVFHQCQLPLMQCRISCPRVCWLVVFPTIIVHSVSVQKLQPWTAYPKPPLPTRRLSLSHAWVGLFSNLTTAIVNFCSSSVFTTMFNPTLTPKHAVCRRRLARQMTSCVITVGFNTKYCRRFTPSVSIHQPRKPQKVTAKTLELLPTRFARGAHRAC